MRSASRALHVLRLVQDEDGPGLLEKLEGLALAGELLGRLVEVVADLVEGVESHHHDLGEGRSGEGAQAAQLAAVVAGEADRLVAVEGAKVIARDLEVLDHALVDSDARDDDDELAEAIALAQLIDRAQVDVGLAGARLHLDREVRVAPGLVAGALHDEPVVTVEDDRFVDAIALLDDSQVVEQPRLAEGLEGR